MNDATDRTSSEAGTSATSNDTTTTVVSAISMPEIGQRIGPNRVLELIAEGGMANVYKVWHEGLEIVRAIKILKPGFNEESKQRLHTEAKISAHLHHPNIVEIYGVFFWKDVVPYLEMEFIDGFSLKDLLKYQKQAHCSFALAVGYFICNALNYAHSQVFTLYGKPYHGVVHRDIKPANILISRSGTVKLADFGIAKPSEISLHTVGQKVMGTFSYLSPEQLNGDPLDYRCDVYSLGTVLYEIVTGIKAFPQKVMSELIQKKMLNEYKPVNAFDTAVPKQFCAIVDKCMSLKKEKRYATAPKLADDILTILDKISSKSPEQIVIDYLKDPKASVQTQRKKPLPTSLAITGIMVLCIAITFTAMMVTPMMRHSIWDALFHTTSFSNRADTKAPSPPPRIAETQTNVAQHHKKVESALPNQTT
ncbi:MAG TPA: serine/threonine-protein kinase, partial [Chitinivibrionales bacterium]